MLFRPRDIGHPEICSGEGKSEAVAEESCRCQCSKLASRIERGNSRGNQTKSDGKRCAVAATRNESAERKNPGDVSEKLQREE